MLVNLIVVSSLLLSVDGKRWHTSQIVLTQLYDLQHEHTNVIENYLDAETQRLEELKKNLAEIFQWWTNNTTKKDVYLHHHINVLKKMKRVNLKFQKIKNLMNNLQSIEVLKKIDEHKDLSGDHIAVAYQALRRLQKFYTISASDMAAGRFNKRIIGDKINACECYVISTYCFEEHDMYGLIDWSVETYNKWKNEGQPKCVDIEKLHFYISWSSLVKGLKGITSIISEKSRFIKNEKIVKFYMIIKNQLLNVDEGKGLDVSYMQNSINLKSKWYDINFIELCKHGKSKKVLTKYSKCRYQTKNSLYRLLMPFKEEDINSDPIIKIYHDVIYDQEILKFKTMVLETIDDSRVRLKASDEGESIENNRLCQVAWINNTNAIGHFDSLDKRIESFTGLSTSSAEKYQIVNYGLGGHFIPHWDAFDVGMADEEFGNRLVTVLFYLNDVENDGYTAFPMLDIISPTEKGAALVFYNLQKSNGLRHKESLHGACPMLKGNKWITTRWLREKGQHLTYNWKVL